MLQVYNETHITPLRRSLVANFVLSLYLIKLDRACIKAPLMQSLCTMWRGINGVDGRRNQFAAPKRKREICSQKGIASKGIHHRKADLERKAFI